MPIAINQIPDHVQPKSAVLAELPRAEIDDVAKALAGLGVPDSDASYLHGEAGIAAYEARGNWLSRHLDDTEDEVLQALRDGDVVVTVHEEDNDRAIEIRRGLIALGARHVHHFGGYTFN